MGRIWIALALGLCLFALGCPKPLPATGNTPGLASPETVTTDLSAPASELPEAEPGGLLEDETALVAPGADGTSAAETGTVGPPLPPGYTLPAETSGAEDDAAAGAKATAAEEAEAEEPAEPDSDIPVRDAMDPGAAKNGLINGPPGYDAQQRSGGAGLAGVWQVLCATTGGESAWYEQDDWTIRLNADGTAVIARKDGAEKWDQQGKWQAEAGVLQLGLGPGGDHEYLVTGEDADVKVLTEESSQTALFILRLAGGAAPQLFHTYQTDFGPLSFTSTGPGKWRGSYGEAGGQLSVRLRGPFCTGTWEQAPARGGVVLRLEQAGFTGWWWYDGSLGFDGRWNGNTGS